MRREMFFLSYQFWLMAISHALARMPRNTVTYRHPKAEEKKRGGGFTCSTPRTSVIFPELSVLAHGRCTCFGVNALGRPYFANQNQNKRTNPSWPKLIKTSGSVESRICSKYISVDLIGHPSKFPWKRKYNVKWAFSLFFSVCVTGESICRIILSLL